MLVEILVHTPAWVWGLLAILIALGLAQTRARRVARTQLLALPLALLLLGLWSMMPGLAPQPLAAAVWVGALGLFGALGWRLPRPPQARWLAAEQRLELPGSWLPMALICAIFALRYAAGASRALHPEWRSVPAVQLPLAAMFGALSGIFVGRAFALLQLTRAPATIAGDEPFGRH